MSENEVKLEEKPRENWPEQLLQKYGELELPSLFDFLISQEKLAAEIRRQNKELINTQNKFTEFREKIELNLNDNKDIITAHFDNTLSDLLNELSDAPLDDDFDEDDEEDFDEHEEYYDGSNDAYAEEKENEDKDEDEDEDEDEDDDLCAKDNEIDRKFFQQLTELNASQQTMQQALMQSLDMIFTLFKATQEHVKNINDIVPEKQGIFMRTKPEWRLKMETSLKSYSEGIKIIQSKLLACCADAQLEVIIPVVGQNFDPNLHRALEGVHGGIKGQVASIIRYGYRQSKNILRYADVSVYQEPPSSTKINLK
jgi:GrpE